MFTEVVLAGSYRDTAPQGKSPARLSSGTEFRFDSFYRRCHAIAHDGKVSHVLVRVKPGFASRTVAALQEIREQLEFLAGHGKQLVFYATDYRDAHLYLASACHRRVIHPLATLRATGLATDRLYFKRVLDEYGLAPQIVRRGRYKSAADPLRVDRPDPHYAEEYQRFLNVSCEHLHRVTITGYGKQRPELEELLGGRILSASEALERGWVSDVASREGLLRSWDEEKLRRRTVKVRSHIGRGKRIAVLTFEGSIVEGESRFRPILGQSIGSDSFVTHVDRLRRDRRTAAVVLRVSSGGGSAVASEDIRLALARLAGEKPLVVSMSELAGSGGYWISMSGATVFARDTTLTGSIGVINIALAYGEALERRGVTHGVVKTHDHADTGRGLRELSEEELAELDRQVASIYDQFLGLVSGARDLSREEVDAHAQGRIWAGADALEHRLVDRLGGLRDAIDEARRRASLSRARIDFYPQARTSLADRLLARALRNVSTSTGLANRAATLLQGGGLFSELATLTGVPLLLMPAAIDEQALLDSRLVHLLNQDLEVE